MIVQINTYYLNFRLSFPLLKIFRRTFDILQILSELQCAKMNLTYLRQRFVECHFMIALTHVAVGAVALGAGTVPTDLRPPVLLALKFPVSIPITTSANARKQYRAVDPAMYYSVALPTGLANIKNADT